MRESEWSEQHITDAAQRILGQITPRASDRGLHVVDDSSIIMMALWSLLLWERKVGRVALERMGVDSFQLAVSVSRLLDAKTAEYPVEYDPKRQQLVFARTREPYKSWDLHSLVGALLQTAEREARELGHDYIGSEHLLLAIVRLANSALTEVLQQHGVEYSKTRAAVLAVLSF